MSRFVFVGLFLVNAVFAQETPPAPSSPTSYRSTPDKHFWIGTNAGLEAGGWGINSGGGLGAHVGLDLRAQFGRCGGVFDWHVESLTYYQPDPDVHTGVIGAGVSCRVANIGEGTRFFNGAHIMVRGLLEYAQNDYEIYDWRDRPVAFGTSYGWGGLVGADFMLPIYVGFWGFIGSGFEALNFQYSIPANTQGIAATGGATWTFFSRIGLAFGFW
jgi:hypothetical protein